MLIEEETLTCKENFLEENNSFDRMLNQSLDEDVLDNNSLNDHLTYFHHNEYSHLINKSNLFKRLFHFQFTIDK